MSLEKLNEIIDGLLIPTIPVSQFPVTFQFYRNTETTPRFSGNKFGQDLEPAGEFMLMLTPDMELPLAAPWITGGITFKHPLVLEHENTGPTGWKLKLSQMFNGKTSKALSKAIVKAGYDAVMTWTVHTDKKIRSEIVNLNGKKF